MKHAKILLTLLLTLILAFSLVACNKIDAEGLWKDATYRRDMSFGEGATTFTVDVVVAEQSVRFAVSTDKETVGAALLEHGLIDGEMGAYGLYVKKVNGITAEYEVDGTYWAFYIGDDYGMTGVDLTLKA